MGIRQKESDFTFLAKMKFVPNIDGIDAGISLFQKDDNYINFTLINKDSKIFLQAYALKNNKLVKVVKHQLNKYNSNIKFKMISNKDNYELYYSIKGTHFNYFATFEGNLVVSNGYTGAHLGIYATSNGEETKDLASFDYVNFISKKK